MKLIGKQIDEIIKSMVVINVPYKASDLKYQLANSGVEISDIQLSRSINRLIKINLLKRIGSGLYIKNPHYFDGDSEFSKELYNVLTNFTENLCEIILKYDINKTNDKDNTRLNTVIHIKEYVDNLVKEMDDEMYFR